MKQDNNETGLNITTASNVNIISTERWALEWVQNYLYTRRSEKTTSLLQPWAQEQISAPITTEPFILQRAFNILASNINPAVMEKATAIINLREQLLRGYNDLLTIPLADTMFNNELKPLRAKLELVLSRSAGSQMNDESTAWRQQLLTNVNAILWHGSSIRSQTTISVDSYSYPEPFLKAEMPAKLHEAFALAIQEFENHPMQKRIHKLALHFIFEGDIIE